MTSISRRKAIWGILLTAAGGALTYSGIKWYGWYKAPDLRYLESSAPLIAALSETIIPATDTPGARDAQVQDFIIRMVRDCADTRTANVFVDGLKDVETYSMGHYNKTYPQCSMDEQHAIMKHFEEKGASFNGIAGKAQTLLMGRSFFSILKDYTVEGYCTSEPGATKGLAYLAVPGAFHGCIPMQPGQRGWATN